MISRKDIYSTLKFIVLPSLVMLCTLTCIVGCARMGSPDGGWYDETPPRIIACTPEENATGVKGKRVTINFDEYIKVEGVQEKVVISPPQMEQADIKTTGKSIRVDLKDSLQANTTYTIDFSDAISDNNEQNPMGNYTFAFSTGETIDTMEVSGYVLDAENLEPVKGILVGLHSNMEDSVFTTMPLQRVARTNGSGKYTIKGVAQGSYRVYALADTDGDYKLSQRGEQLAFSHETITTSAKPDIRQDTIWQDSLRIRDIERVPYTHFFPDDFTLLAFKQELTDRYFLKTERVNPESFTLFFSNGCDELPKLTLLNPPAEMPNLTAEEAFLVEHTLRNDTVTYWIRDSLLINQDTLDIAMDYLMTDTLGALVVQTDTMTVFPKIPLAKRQKLLEQKQKDWEKLQEKARKRGEEAEERMPKEALEPRYEVPSTMTPMTNVRIKFPAPLDRLDTTSVHLYSKIDTLWYRAPFRLEADTLHARTYELSAEWRSATEYSLEVDSAAFRDIYGRVSNEFKKGIKVASDDDFGTLFVEVANSDSTTMVQLLNSSDKMVAETYTDRGIAEFYYLKPGTYYLRKYQDINGNGQWDTGDYSLDLQAEPVEYHPEKFEIKAKWDLTVRFNPNNAPLYRQKPYAITKQKADFKKQPRNRNEARAQQLGIQYVPKAPAEIKKKVKKSKSAKEETADTSVESISEKSAEATTDKTELNTPSTGEGAEGLNQ